MMPNGTYTVAVCSFLLASCGRGGLSPADYVRWVEDPANGLLQALSLDGFHYSAQYAPHEYLALMDNKRADMSNLNLKDAMLPFEGFDYFIVKMEPVGSTTTTAWYEPHLDLLSFGLQKDFNLVSDGDTIPCGVYHFLPPTGVNGPATITLAFKQDDIPQERSLIMGSNPLQAVRFDFPYDRISNTPEVNI